VTALVYSLTPKDLYGTIMPTCYTNMTKEIWNFGKALTLSYRRASRVSIVETNNVRQPINHFRFKRWERKSSTGCAKQYFAKFRLRRGSWCGRYVTNDSSLGTNAIVARLWYLLTHDVYDCVRKYIHYTLYIILLHHHYWLFWIIPYNSSLYYNFLNSFVNLIFYSN